MYNVTLNTKHVEVFVLRHLSGAFVTSVTALVLDSSGDVETVLI